MGRGRKPAKSKEATPQNDGARVHDLETRLAEALKDKAEALEQQTATSEILSVISRSPTDAQPVFEAIVRSAVRLCNARFANVFRLENDVVHLAAHHNVPFDALEHFRRTFPQPLSQGGTLTAQAMREGTVVHIHDVEAQPGVAAAVRALTRSAGYRTVLAVPILRPGNVVGAIGVGRSDVSGAPWPFSDKEVALLRIFADQAVIAIENVRLFKELETRNRELTQSLEQQTATAEILQVISSSPTDIQPVLDAVAANAARVCGAVDAVIRRVEGADMRRVAHFGPIPLVLPEVRRITEGSAAGRAILECRAIHLHDAIDTDVARDYPDQDARGWRTTLAVPLVREDVAIGAIVIRRTEVQPFTASQIKLLETFADQAVIAIENVRLFKELETLVRERAGRRGIALQLAVDERLGQMRADERKVRQVVLNLLSNAIKFTSEGGRIEVAAAPKDGSVEVSVSDTGVGIAPEDQEAVFEEFRQVGTAAKKVEGTGLGLTLCRKFVELHGGKIWVKSQVGEGATFTFTIPAHGQARAGAGAP